MAELFWILRDPNPTPRAREMVAKETTLSNLETMEDRKNEIRKANGDGIVEQVGQARSRQWLPRAMADEQDKIASLCPIK